MSTSEQHGEPQLTRKQLREIRMTGATPIIGPDGPMLLPPTEPFEMVVLSSDSAEDDGVDDVASAETPVSAAQPFAAFAAPQSADSTPAPEPTAAAASVSIAPIADADVDLSVAPLTRRQARQQELIRTASVPVITSEALAEHAAAKEQERVEAEPADEDEIVVVAEPVDEAEPDDEAEPASAVDADDAEAPVTRPVLDPAFGSELLAGTDSVILPSSFDQLINRGVTSSGSLSTPSALILSQAATGGSPIISPVNATGEVLITGSFDLPEGLGSTGHALGATDGKDADAALLDREIPASSSPTPIAASAAISTVKGNAEIIRPPAPEKGSRLMLTLAITAGALALALVGVLILAFITGAL